MDAIRVDNDAAVGIGTKVLSVHLHVKNTIGVGIIYVYSAYGNASGISVSRADGVWSLLHSGANAAQIIFEHGKEFDISEADANDAPIDSTYSNVVKYLTLKSGGNKLLIF